MENDSRYNISRYFHKFIVGVTYGLSFPLTMVILDYWLKSIGVSNSVIGLFSLLQWPFALKFVWGIFVDNYDIPLLSKIVGRRKSWIALSYIILIIGLLGMAFSLPHHGLYVMAFFASIVSIADGCKNVAMYPYQIDKSKKHELGYVASVVSLGHRVGMILIKVVTLYFAEVYNWKTAYIVAAALVFVSFVIVMFLDEPQHTENQDKNFIDELKKNIAMCFSDKHIILLLILYKAADFMTQKMSRVLCVEVGFSPVEIANIVQIGGTCSVVLGAFIGGYIVKNKGIYKAMFLLGALHAVFLSQYILLTFVGNDLCTLAIISFFDGITGGAVTAAFIAFLYKTSINGTQYALFWAIHGCASMIFMSLSGIIIDCTSWRIFFSIVPLVAVPGLITIKEMGKRIR